MPDFNTIEEVVEDLQNGRMIVLVDECEAVGEGVLVMLAERATATSVNFMTRCASSPPVVAATEEHLKALELHLQVSKAHEPLDASIMVSVNARAIEGTGVSAQDRAATIRKLADSDSAPEDFVQPGHVTPLQAQPGGVLRRAGHTEASVDLAQMADLPARGLDRRHPRRSRCAGRRGLICSTSRANTTSRSPPSST